MDAYQRLDSSSLRRLRYPVPEPQPALEPWLRAPRRLDLVTRAGQPLYGDSLEYVRRARAAVGVVVHSKELPGDREGPDFDVRVLFDAAGEPALYRFQSGYDSYHWAMSSPEHASWFRAAMLVQGAQLSVLYDPDEGTALPFGQMEAFVPLTLAELLAQAAAEPAQRERWLYACVDLLQSMRVREPQRFFRIVGAVMMDSVGMEAERWPREIARRVRLDEAPEEPLAELAAKLSDVREPVWAALYRHPGK